MAEELPKVTLKYDQTIVIDGPAPLEFHSNAAKTRVRVTSPKGQTPTPPAPVASFSANPTTGSAPLTIVFTDTSTNDPTSRLWKIDGATYTTPTVTKTFTLSGVYLIELTATNAGGSSTITGNIVIKAAQVPSTSNILGVDFSSRPRSGAAWDRMLAASKNLGPVTLTDTSGTNNGELLAAAFVAAATNDAGLKSKIVSICKDALNGAHKRTLEQARNLAPIAIALNAIGDHSLDTELRRERDYKADSQGSVIDCHKKRPNNWGTCSGLARIAVSAHLVDTADVVAAVAVHKGYLGDRSVYAGFEYGDTSWQADSSKPVGINPRGSTKSGQTIDGVLPDDQRRGGNFPNWTNQNYVWQALGELAGTQYILRACGYPDIFGWSDGAVSRAYALYVSKGYGSSGDDAWQYQAAADRGVTIQHDGYAPGKSFGWADWLYG